MECYLRFILVLIFCTYPVFSQQNQFLCNGPQCQAINSKYGNYFNSFASLYLPELTKDVIVSQAMNGSLSTPFVNIYKFSVGGSIVGSATKGNNIYLKNSSDSEVKKTKEYGAAVTPKIFLGVNLGWMVEYVYGSEFPLLYKIDMYAYGSGRVNNTDIEQNYNYLPPQHTRKTMNSLGYSVRIHLIDETPLFFFGILKYSGLSLGSGQYKSGQTINYIFKDSFKLSVLDAISLEWKGKNEFGYSTYTYTSFYDLRTGFSLFRFLEVYGGIGTSHSTGSAQIYFQRTGVLKGITDPTATQYSFNLYNYQNHKVDIGYLLAGVNLGGFNIQGAKSINRNSLTNRQIYSISIGFSANY